MNLGLAKKLQLLRALRCHFLRLSGSAVEISSLGPHVELVSSCMRLCEQCHERIDVVSSNEIRQRTSFNLRSME